MAGGKISEAQIFGLTIRESANDGSDFTNPAADYRRLFLGEDGELHTKDSSGTVAGMAGSGIAATLADNAGDMLVASAADTWAKLATPTVNGQALQRVSGSPAWALPPGYEYDYTQITSNASLTATTEGTANTIVTASAVTFDGSTIVLIEWWAPHIVIPADAGGRSVNFWLYEDGSSIGRLGSAAAPGVVSGSGGTIFGGGSMPVGHKRRMTPASGSRTYSIRGSVSGGTATVAAGAGGAATILPAFIRITKV